jgi:hypothetical protein
MRPYLMVKNFTYDFIKNSETTLKTFFGITEIIEMKIKVLVYLSNLSRF